MPTHTLFPRIETLDALAHTRNPQATRALACGLLTASAELRSKCVQLLLARPEEAARAAIVGAWTRLDAALRQSLASKKFELQPACRDLIKSGPAGERQAAIAAVCDLDMTAALPELIGLALEQQSPLCDCATQAIFELCDRWGQRARQDKDVPSVRLPMIEAMSRMMIEYPMHKNDELVDAWLLLVNWEDSAQRAILNDPLHPAFRAVLKRFGQSQHVSVLQLLGGYLWRSSTPKSVLSILSERADHELAVHIASMLDEHTMPQAIRRLREIAPLNSLAGLSSRPSGVSAEIQKRLWLMLAANSQSVEPVLAGAVSMSKLGTSEGRRTAAEIIRNCQLRDVEPLVKYLQYAAANPEDNRSAGAHLQTILGWVDSPSKALNDAAREFFAEFTLAALLDVVRKWPTPLCRVMAQVVSRLEPEAVPQLLKALESPSPKRRIVALQAIRLMDLTSEVNERLLPLVHDSRIEVRVPAIDLLAALAAPQLLGVLPELLADPTTDVQDAAMRAKRRLERRFRNSTTAATANTPTMVAAPLSVTPAAMENEAATC